MTRGRSRKKHRTPRKSTDENDHSQSGQGEEIVTPLAQRTSPRRGTESEVGNDIYYATCAVSPNVNHRVQNVAMLTVDPTDKPATNAAQRLEDQEFEDPDNQELFLQCLTPIWHRDICVFC